MNVEKAEEERIFLQSSRVVLAMLKSYETRNQQNEEQTLVIGDDQDCPEAHQRGATWVLPVLCLYAVSPLSDRIYGTVTVRYGPKPYNTVKMKIRYGSTGNRSTVQACMATRFEARARPPLDPNNYHYTVGTCTRSAPLGKWAIFTLSDQSAPLSIYNFSACRTNPHPGLRLCLAASVARCFCTCCLNFCPSSRCCCSRCSAVGGGLQKLAIPVWTRPTGALSRGLFPTHDPSKTQK